MEKVGAFTDRATENGEWRPGNPASGQQATPMLAAYFNMLQRELVNLVSGAGLTLNKNDDSQLFKAIQSLQTAASTWAKLGGKPTTVAGFGLLDVFTKTETGAAIQTAISALVASSPAALDTLKELATALGNDPNFATTMTNALAGKAAKATTLDGYGITDALKSASPAVTGKVGDLPATQFFTMAEGTTDKPPTVNYGSGVHIKYPLSKVAFDIAAGITNEWYGVRLVSSDGTGAWRTLLHSGIFDPGSKADIASPALEGTPTAPTAAVGSNNQQVANAAFVWAAINTYATTVANALALKADATAVISALALKADASTIVKGVGDGQTWQNVTANRVSGTTYTNSTGRPIVVSCYAEPAAANILNMMVSGLVVAQNTVNNATSGANSTVSAVVPPGATYSVTRSLSTIAVWAELR